MKLTALVMAPQIKEDDGTSRAWYPGEVEEQVEQAIWKLADDVRRTYPSEHFREFFFFPLKSIQAELTRSNLDYTDRQIEKAMEILSLVTIYVCSEDAAERFSVDVRPFSGLDIIKRSSAVFYNICFNSYVTASIE